MVLSICGMDNLFRFRIPHRWKLHRRGHSPTRVDELTKKDTPPTSDIDAPKKDTSPANTEPGSIGMKQKPLGVQTEYFCDTRLGTQRTDASIPKIQEDYFFGPIGDCKEEEAQPESKSDTTDKITLPLKVFRSIETQLSTVQLNRTKIKMLDEKCKRIAKELELAEEKLRMRDHTIEVLAEVYREEREKALELQKNTGKMTLNGTSHR